MITYDMATEWEPHKFITEASTIGLGVGDWPKTLETTMGNKRPFVLIEVDDSQERGEVSKVRYFQEFGCIELTVVNT